MKGNVCTRAKTNIAHATQLCQLISFSCEIPISKPIGFALVANILFPSVLIDDECGCFEGNATHYINGMHANAMNPAWVAMGGEFPKLNSFVLGQ
jgi:hypothetical protein